ncbi:MAG: hypothetical protein RJA57_31 [Bacteroidota bacterium]|jgi:hypothetical protein
MRYILPLLTCGAALMLLAATCKQSTGNGLYKGRLEVDGLCKNYTIAFTGTPPANATVAASWTDSNTGTTYRNVFRLGNPCDFPETIKKGDEFQFRIVEAKTQNCAICRAFYPTPSEALNIEVTTR